MRTTSKAIRDLELRIARLERQADEPDLKEVPITLGIRPIPYFGSKKALMRHHFGSAAKDFGQILRRLGAQNYNRYAWEKHPKRNEWAILTFTERPEIVERIIEWTKQSPPPQIETRYSQGRFVLFHAKL